MEAQLNDKVKSLDLEQIQNLYQSLYVNKKVIEDVSSVQEVKYERKADFSQQMLESYEPFSFELINFSNSTK